MKVECHQMRPKRKIKTEAEDEAEDKDPDDIPDDKGLKVKVEEDQVEEAAAIKDHKKRSRGQRR